MIGGGRGDDWSAREIKGDRVPIDLSLERDGGSSTR